MAAAGCKRASEEKFSREMEASAARARARSDERKAQAEAEDVAAKAEPSAVAERASKPVAPIDTKARDEERAAALEVVGAYLKKKRVPHHMEQEISSHPGYIVSIIITDACSQRLVDDVAHENGAVLVDAKVFRLECRNAQRTRTAAYTIGW